MDEPGNRALLPAGGTTEKTEHDARQRQQQQLRDALAVELEERVQALNRLLLELERPWDATAVPALGGDGPAAELYDALFREAHSLKGAARMVGLGGMEQLAHAFESALTAARQQGSRPTDAWFKAAYQTADTFHELQFATQEGEEMPPDGLAAVLVALAGAAEAAEAAGADPAAPAPRRAEAAATTLAPDRSPAGHPIAGQPPAHRPAPPAPPVSAPPLASASTGALGRRGAPESVRVAVGKLDGLLAQTGTLAVTHLRLEQRLAELRSLRPGLEAGRREWRSTRVVRSMLGRVFETGTLNEHAAIAQEVEAHLATAERVEQHFEAAIDQLDGIIGRLRSDTAQLGLVARALQDDVMAVRLLPTQTVFEPFERTVRDLGRQRDKEVRLVLAGGDTEVDRKILEQLHDPLLHMVRNAVDHGIESPAERTAGGKGRVGTITLTADLRGGRVEIEVEDDGRGLVPETLRRRAVATGLLSAEQAAELDDTAAVRLIFKAGFTTSAGVTETSGRGVGMDVVREQVERLGGEVRIQSTPGRGTCFTLSVPLTLATTRVVLVEQGGQLFALPSAAIVRSGRVAVDDILHLEGRQAVAVVGRPVPVVELGVVLEHDRPPTPPGDTGRTYLVLQYGERRLALLVDRLVDEQEVVVKSLGWPLRRVRNVSSAAVLGSGQIVVILNPADLLRVGLRLAGTDAARPGQRALTMTAGHSAEHRRRRLLVVDDSLTTRTLERSILQTAGYDVVVASDGIEALHILHSQSIDLVVSDVQMPRLDGFALTAEIRRDERLRQTPVVLVTSLDAAEHRARGASAGADAYIIKRTFDQGELLETVGRLL